MADRREQKTAQTCEWISLQNPRQESVGCDRWSLIWPEPMQIGSDLWRFVGLEVIEKLAERVGEEL
jgi:hypothetical protein